MRARRCELQPRAGRRTVRGARRGAYPKTPRQNTGYVVLIVSFQKNCQKFLNRTPLVFQIRTGVRFTHQVVRFMVR